MLIIFYFHFVRKFNRFPCLLMKKKKKMASISLVLSFNCLQHSKGISLIEMVRWISFVSHFGISSEFSRFCWNLRPGRFLILSFYAVKRKKRRETILLPLAQRVLISTDVNSFKIHLTATVDGRRSIRKKGSKGRNERKKTCKTNGKKWTSWTCLCCVDLSIGWSQIRIEIWAKILNKGCEICQS